MTEENNSTTDFSHW